MLPSDCVHTNMLGHAIVCIEFLVFVHDSILDVLFGLESPRGVALGLFPRVVLKFPVGRAGQFPEAHCIGG